MLQSYLAFRDAKKAGAYDALLINRKGYVTEGTRTNIFCISGNIIVSPLEKDILLGVTRMHVLQVAKANGFKVENRNLRIEDLESADSVFITSTSTKIMPVRSVDKILLKQASPELKRLMVLYGEFIKNEI
jgi:branched-subunit amino acid aminotransferase/4-amino-4-deoxychorismate lyase